MSVRIEAAIRELADALLEAARAELAPADGADRLLSVDEAAARWGIGRTRLYAELAAGRVRSLKVGRRRLIPSSALPQYVEQVLGTPALAHEASHDDPAPR